MATIGKSENIETKRKTVVDEDEFQSKQTLLKKEKVRVKSNFTRSRHQLMLLLETDDLPSRRAVKEACKKLESAYVIAMEVTTSLSDLYDSYGESDNCKKVIAESEQIESEFAAASDSAKEYLVSRKDELSSVGSVASETLHIDLLQEMNIADTEEKQFPTESAERDMRQLLEGKLHQTPFQEVRKSEMNHNIRNSPYSNPMLQQNVYSGNAMQPNVVYELTNVGGSHWTDRLPSDTGFQNVANMSGMNSQAVPGHPSRSSSAIGQDLWKQLKRVQIPVFSGDKRSYQSWKAAFLACIDNAPATAEYKLLQLRQYLSGEALSVIDNLGHSATAYEAAKERLERKYGGKRRQIAIYLEELENFRQIRHGNSKDMEHFADLLDIAIINLKEAGQYHELGDGSLYSKLQRKLPESMLASYHRWIFENKIIESVVTLRTWVIQESEFQTIASETVHGLIGNLGSNTESTKSFVKNQNMRRTFFGGIADSGKNRNSHCTLCGREHAIWRCNEFLQMYVQERWNIAKQYELCYRCLGNGHRGNSCPRSRPCGIDGCRDVHSRLLHRHVTPLQRSSPGTSSHTQIFPNVDDQVTSALEGKQTNSQVTMMTQAYQRADYIGLRTVPVILKNGTRSLKVNALLDDASTKTYVNADIAAELGLQGKSEKVVVNVLNGQVETFETKPINVRLESVNGNMSMNVNAYTANRVTGNMTAVDWNKYSRQWSHLKEIEFPRTASRPIVDILIGLDCADLHCSIREIRGRPGEPIARLTPLGWTCIGNPGSCNKQIFQTNFASTYFVRDQSGIEEVNANLKKFWEIENVSPSETMPIVRIEEQLAMKKAENSIKYENNMYRIGVPWKNNEPSLPENYEMAFHRLQNTERRLQKSQDIATQYKQCIDQYIEKGYVRKVTEYEQNKSKWYLPHFPVIRPDKDTTKTRIVFDASAKCEGVSLNDTIHQGPKLQRELFDVLLRFRRFPVAIVCDIAEMYLRIGIAPEDKPYHRFLWRGMNQCHSPDVYEFDRVVFGVNSSPFQAQYVSQQHAKKYQDEFPMAAETVLKSTYMDDSMDSVLNEEQGIELYKQLSQLWSKAGMHARKWLSNSKRVLMEIPQQDRKSEVDLDSGHLPSAKTLGVWWLTGQDVFSYRENGPDNDMVYTKRNFLKKIATLFDPIGLLAPFTVRAKLLLQDMWTAGVDWDEELNDSLINSARTWFGELSELTQIEIPRCLSEKQKTVDTMQLHTFVDASEHAYGAVVYARYTYQDGSISSNIVAAKTRVAPSISTSIPRLELMGAIIGIRLAITVSKALEMSMAQSIFWSDSMNVLWWIRGRSREFKPFVANRVGEIQSNTSPEQWRYVPSTVNPADILSRGMKAVDLAESDTWWKGPTFLRESKEVWPENKICRVEGCNELKGTPGLNKILSESSEDYAKDPRSMNGTEHSESAFTSVVAEISQLKPEKYSSWLKLTRIQAWINRFIENCKLPTGSRIDGELISDEIKKAEVQLIKQTQRSEFMDEWLSLSREKPLPAHSKLLGLQPKLDEDGLMRSDGRLVYAKFLSYDVRFPVILPRRSWITKLIVKHCHEIGKHASGINQTLSALSSRYWIISGREVIREWEKECAECRRRKAKACKQIMAPLPIIRLKTSLRAFTRTSVDFGGPFITIQGRGKRREKRYLCLFTCLATRAVHLEVANGLDTDSFLNAFYRMASRRGLPEEMLSDNGTNFKSADKELKSLVSQLDNDKINESTANKGVKWTFNPPLAPHFGGVHETMIKSAKKAISAILGNADITDEELQTAVIGAESLINSRPLTYQTADPEDDTPLTPNHFLHGQMGGQFAPQSADLTEFSPRRRWRRVQELVRHFWHRWLREWLPRLTARKKWFQPSRDIQVGEVVLVISPDTSRGNWPLGRVLAVYPGQDGHIRVAKVQVGRNALMRPVSKLCPLECDVPRTTDKTPDRDT